MSVPTDGADDLRRAEKIVLMSTAMVARFGADARVIAEGQIFAAVDDDARASWTAIWNRLCI